VIPSSIEDLALLAGVDVLLFWVERREREKVREDTRFIKQIVQ
jgi:hypothetical protein